MSFVVRAALAVALIAPLSAASAAVAPDLRSGNPVFDRTVDLVLANFYRPAELDRFRDAVGLTVESLPGLGTAEPAVVDDAIDFVLASLETSHTARYPVGTVEYYELLDVFRYAVRDAVRRLYPPDGNISYDGIGFATRSIAGATYVTDVYDGGPADKAGLLAGDEILWVDGKPYDPVDTFRGRTEAGSILTVRRDKGADPITITVPVARLEPSEALVDATAASAEVIARDGHRIGYLRIWAYTERDMKATIEAAITGPLADADGLVLDLRCRWGGAPADAADTFIGGAPDMSLIFRNGKTELAHARWRKPMVAIVDEGTRSGMEIFAYGLKAHGVPLVGMPTAGNVVAGRGYALPDDSLLIIAVADVTVDGARLEGNPVTPDVVVPFDVRYAAGRDPQREAAIETLVGNLAGDGPAMQSGRGTHGPFRSYLQGIAPRSRAAVSRSGL
jgi:carboxyl-terminal processing protease